MTMLPFSQVAPIRRRVLAYVIDAAIGFAISFLIPVVVMIVVVTASQDAAGLIIGLMVAGPLFGILGIAWLIVYTIMQGGRGSIGMRALGIRLGDATDGSPVGFGRALLRNVIWGLAGSIVVGYFSVLFDGSGLFQGWHDKVGGAVMLDARTHDDWEPPQYLDTTQPPLIPSAVGVRPAAQTAMPGFAAPQSGPPSPQTSMPGFAPSPTGFPVPPAAPAAAAPAPAGPASAAPAPAPTSPTHGAPAAAAPASAAPQDASASVAGAVPPSDHEFAEHTVLTPRISRDLPDDPLISFVPGVTQEPARPAEPVQPAEPLHREPPAPSAPVEPVPAPAPAWSASPIPDAASVQPGREAAAPAAPASQQAALTTDADDDEDIESTRISVPGHRLVFTWDDGQRSTVSGRTVFGRNPEERDGAVNVAVRDETRSLSKTHFEAGADARGGWVMDRQSTNGTVVVREGVRIACPPGQRVPVRLGDALEIGDRIVTIGGYV